MERTLNVERLYYLGDYKNIKFGNSLSGIPEELAGNDKVVSLLFLQQSLACEAAYRTYSELMEHINSEFTVDVRGKKVVDTQQVLQYLTEKREQTFDDLMEEIKAVQEAKKQDNLAEKLEQTLAEETEE